MKKIWNGGFRVGDPLDAAMTGQSAVDWRNLASGQFSFVLSIWRRVLRIDLPEQLSDGCLNRYISSCILSSSFSLPMLLTILIFPPLFWRPYSSFIKLAMSSLCPQLAPSQVAHSDTVSPGSEGWVLHWSKRSRTTWLVLRSSHNCHFVNVSLSFCPGLTHLHLVPEASYWQ